MMKILSLCVLSLVCSFVSTAQVKTTQSKPVAKKAVKKTAAKPAPGTVKKTTINTTNAPAVAVAQPSAATTPAPVAQAVAPAKADSPKESAPAADVKKQKLVDKQSLYSSAVGLKFLWGVAITGKHFFKEHHAAEAIFKFRGYHGIGTDMTLALMYEYHGDIPVDGLRWYAGAGIFGGHFRLKNKYLAAADYTGKRGSSYFGMSGILGAEYKIKDFLLAVSADWQATVMFNIVYVDSGFSAEYGGIGVKYTF